MKIITAYLLLALSGLSLFSQVTKKESLPFQKKNSIQVEAFGHGLIYSVNYERVVLNFPHFKTMAQIGLGYFPPKTGLIQFWVPVLFTQLFSFNQHHIELGGGHVYIDHASPLGDNNLRTFLTGGFLTARLGYRFQKPDGRWIFRAAFTPFAEFFGSWNLSQIGIYPSGGLAVGYGF